MPLKSTAHKRILTGVLFLLLSVSPSAIAGSLEWSKITSLPSPDGRDHPGLAGCFAGFHKGVLIVAGGANFPEGAPWEGGEKRWYEEIYLLHNEGEDKFRWESSKLELPVPLAYGVSITTPGGVVCIGGNNSDSCTSDVFRLSFSADEQILSMEHLPALPIPLAHMSGYLLNEVIYIAGGQQSMSEPEALKVFLKLDLSKEGSDGFGWEELASWPGQARAFSVMTAQGDGESDCVFLFSGRDFGPHRETRVLSDGYKFNPILDQWTCLSCDTDLRFPVMAGNAIPAGNQHVIFPNGDDGTVYSDVKNHPGFNFPGMTYNTITGTKQPVGGLPSPGVVTAPLVEWEGAFYLISGEIRPGIRSPQILRGRFIEDSRKFGSLNILVLVIYFGFLVWIGYHFSKRQKNTDDYFRGGGRVPWWAAGLSIFGTALSAITFMAIPAKSFATNWAYIWLNASILVSAPLVVFFFIPLYRRLKITTAYEYLEIRFNLVLRLAGSISFILFQIGRMGVVLFLPAIALNVVSGIDIYICILLMGGLSLLYTFMGGIEAVIWTDAMQVVVLLGGAVLSLILITLNLENGFSGVIQTAVQDQKFAAFDMALDLRKPTFWVILFGGLFSSFATYGTDQTMVQRYLTTSDMKGAKKSLWTNIILTVPATLLFFFMGTALYAFYKQNPGNLDMGLQNGDSIFPWFIVNELPDGIVGVMISGIFAASMSSVSSSINSAATSYSSDIHFRFRPQAANQGLRIARIATIVMGVSGTLFALFMASWEIKSLWDVFNKVLGLIIGSLGGLFLLGVLFRKAHAKGAMIGFVISLLVQVYIATFTHIHLMLYTASGVLTCVLAGGLFSLLLPDSNPKGNPQLKPD
jgi:SSS family solute:Na+ symporter